MVFEIKSCRSRIGHPAVHAPLTTIRSDGQLLSCNRYGANYLGYEPGDLIGKPLSTLIYEADAELSSTYLKKTLAQPEQIHTLELRMVASNGSRLWVRETSRAINLNEGGADVLLVCEDITETRKLSEQLSYQASHDPLTRLLNRREFDRRLKRVLEASHGEETEHALCYLDLDQFKVINDN